MLNAIEIAESCHPIREGSPEDYSALADFLVENDAKKGVNVNKLVLKEMTRSTNLNDDQAFEEVIAQSCESFLLDIHLSDKAEQLYKTDKGLANKIKNILNRILNAVKKWYGVAKPQSIEANYVSEMKDALSEAYDKYIAGIRAASENLRNMEKPADEGGARFELRDMGLEEFDKNTRNNINIRGGIVINGASDLQYHIHQALHSKQKANLYLGAISEKTKKQIESDINNTVFKDKQYAFRISYDDIRHIHDHFKDEAVMLSEVYKLYDIISRYDNVSLDVSPKGVKKLIFDKSYTSADYRTVEIASNKSASLDLVTLFITKNNIKGNQSVPSATGNSSSQRGSVSSINNISQSDTNINTSTQKNQSRSDADYLSAVERGDMETAQRMVDEAAERAFAKSKIRDDDGKLMKVYHGTYADFTVFDKAMGRSTADIQGMFFSPWDIDAKGYGPNLRVFYLNITNPADERTGYKALSSHKGENYVGIKAREDLERMGYDGVNNSDEEYIAFNSEQIKLADPVTYDDNGDVIPLSERFNDSEQDVRYQSRLSAYDAFSELSEEGKNETIDILSRLANGQAIPMNQVDGMELFVNADKQRGELNETININTPQRERLRREVQNKIENLGSAVEKDNKMLYNGDVKREYRADIVIGLPSAGKSTVLVDPLSALYGARIVDSDMVKELLPEYNNGLGAGNVHEESKKINERILKHSCENGENIVMPIVGSDANGVIRRINFLTSKGYDVYLHLNELPMYKALGRMITRYIEKGRYLDPSIIYKYQNKPTEVFEQIIKQKGDLLSGYSRYSNDVAYGERPIFKEGTEDYYGAYTRRFEENSS